MNSTFQRLILLTSFLILIPKHTKLQNVSSLQAVKTAAENSLKMSTKLFNVHNLQVLLTKRYIYFYVLLLLAVLFM